MTVATGAVYVYGIVPAGARWGVDGDAPPVDVVTSGPISAVVAAVTSERPFGLAEDLRNHDRVVAWFVERGVPILPMRFGMVIADRETIELRGSFMLVTPSCGVRPRTDQGGGQADQMAPAAIFDRCDVDVTEAAWGRARSCPRTVRRRFDLGEQNPPL